MRRQRSKSSAASSSPRIGSWNVCAKRARRSSGQRVRSGSPSSGGAGTHTHTHTSTLSFCCFYRAYGTATQVTGTFWGWLGLLPSPSGGGARSGPMAHPSLRNLRIQNKNMQAALLWSGLVVSLPPHTHTQRREARPLKALGLVTSTRPNQDGSPTASFQDVGRGGRRWPARRPVIGLCRPLTRHSHSIVPGQTRNNISPRRRSNIARGRQEDQLFGALPGTGPVGLLRAVRWPDHVL